MHSKKRRFNSQEETLALYGTQRHLGAHCAHISYRKIACAVVCPSQTAGQLASATYSWNGVHLYMAKSRLPNARTTENLVNNSGTIKALSWNHSRWSDVEGPLSKERRSRETCLWRASLLVIYIYIVVIA